MMPPMEIAPTIPVIPVEPVALRITVAKSSVAIVIPDTGLLEEPIRPTIREDTVAKKNPNTDRVILQLHGGGYVGRVRNAYYVFAGLYNEVSRGCAVLTPDYRVAPEHKYPAALEDAIASYKWLLDQGYSGEQIIVAGDSAGGGLAMCLTMYLRDHNMPVPGGLVAMSPWTDLTASGESYDCLLYTSPSPRD